MRPSDFWRARRSSSRRGWPISAARRRIPENLATENRTGGTTVADELAKQRVITQIGIVVRDVEAKARAWSELFGLPMPTISETGAHEVTHAEYRGAATHARAKLAFFRFENITIELIEPVGAPST